MSNFSLVFRMRSEALLSLLFILALSDGADHNDRYDEFKRKHILPTGFQTDNETVWVDYLVRNDLCGRTPVQSFIKDSEENVTQICSGAGTKTKHNYIKSTNLFQVYMIKSKKNMSEWKCIEKCHTAKYSVIFECENNLPVHYHDQHIEKDKNPYLCCYW